MDAALEPTVANVELLPVVIVISAKDGEADVCISCGVVKVTAPVPPVPLAETVTLFAVPVIEVTPIFVIVTAPVAELTEIPVEPANEVTMPDNKIPEPA